MTIRILAAGLVLTLVAPEQAQAQLCGGTPCRPSQGLSTVPLPKANPMRGPTLLAGGPQLSPAAARAFARHAPIRFVKDDEVNEIDMAAAPFRPRPVAISFAERFAGARHADIDDRANTDGSAAPADARRGQRTPLWRRIVTRCTRAISGMALTLMLKLASFA